MKHHESKTTELINKLHSIKTKGLYKSDFLLTWEKSLEDLEAVFLTADILKNMRDTGLSTRLFDTGMGVSIFRDNSTRTRFSFAGACNMLGLSVQDLDETKSQLAHGETERETATMISFTADMIGIRDDMYIGKGNTYMRQFGDTLDEAKAENVIPDRPGIINLQCDIDHPTQTMSDTLHLRTLYGGTKQLKGKKIAMSWAYSPSYGKPLSVPQGIIGLLTRFGADVVLAHPPGYEVMEDVSALAGRQSKENGGSFSITNSMKDAFEGADIVYPKSWAPYAAMEKRTLLYETGDSQGIKQLEKELLAQNAEYKSWECTEDLMKLTKPSPGFDQAMYMHCLPADISGVSCTEGEVSASVFDRYRVPLYREAGYKPYIIAAMMVLNRFKNPAEVLEKILKSQPVRIKE